LTDETIDASGIYTATGDEVRHIVGWYSKDWHWGEAMAFPYPNSEGFIRVKPDDPRWRDGKPIKYESPRKSGNHAYFQVTSDPSAKSFVITEGEKKALAVSQCGTSCIGLSGVWGWCLSRPTGIDGKKHGPYRLIPDLAKLAWQGADVVILFDADIETNRMVQLAELRLAQTLQTKGATVRLGRIPPVADKKMGADDFLVANGCDALLKVIADAEEPKPLDALSPMGWARMFLTEYFDGEYGREMRWHRDTFYRWTGTHYMPVAVNELQALVFKWLDKCKSNAKPSHAADVVKGIAAECRVQFDYETPRYLGDR